MKTRPTTFQSSKVRHALALMIALSWIAAVAAVTVDWTADLSTKVAAVASIAASALFWAAAFRQWVAAIGVLYAGLALVLVMLNSTVAFGNLHRQTVDQRDHRGAIAGTIAEQSAQRSRLSRARVEAVAIAGEKPTETLSAEIDALAAENASRWRATNGCAADRITLAASAAFCSQIAGRKAALAAARRRDAIDNDLAARASVANATPTVSEADPFGTGIAQLLGALGWSLSHEAQAMLPTLRDALRAVLLELVGAMAPAATLALFGFGAAPTAMRSRPRRTTARTFERARRFLKARLAVSPVAPTTTNPSEPLELFLSERTETVKGESVAAGELWSAWLSWCRLNGAEPGTQKAFGLRMSARFRREGTGRPRYTGVKLLPIGPLVVPMRVAKSVRQPAGLASV